MVFLFGIGASYSGVSQPLRKTLYTWISWICHTFGAIMWINTLRPMKYEAFSQTTYSNAFSWMKMYEFRLRFHWNLFPMFELTIAQHYAWSALVNTRIAGIICAILSAMLHHVHFIKKIHNLGNWYCIDQTHDDVIKWKHFPRNWPFVRGIHRSRWIPHTKASDTELWCFLCSAS